MFICVNMHMYIHTFLTVIESMLLNTYSTLACNRESENFSGHHNSLLLSFSFEFEKCPLRLFHSALHAGDVGIW